MSHRAKTSIYYLSQLLIVVIAIAARSPALADDSLPRISADPLPSLNAVKAVPQIADLTIYRE
jgi:hypothetical protein